MVIVDECHHVPVLTFENVLKAIPAKYTYGLTATPKRADGQQPILHMYLGPIRYQVDALTQAMLRPFAHLMIPRFTGAAYVAESGGRVGLTEIERQMTADAPLLICATGKYIGEGFDESRLDTLFLTMPISWAGTLAQYAGRLHRQHEGKQEVRIYDYIDNNTEMLTRMYNKRLKGYAAIGYQAAAAPSGNAAGNLIYSSGDYWEKFFAGHQPSGKANCDCKSIHCRQHRPETAGCFPRSESTARGAGRFVQESRRNGGHCAELDAPGAGDAARNRGGGALQQSSVPQLCRV